MLLQEPFVQVQALQQRVPGPRSQPVSQAASNCKAVERRKVVDTFKEKAGVERAGGEE